MIGTILMVAITVVLAAVLYAMIGGWNRPPDQPMVGLVRQETGQNWTLMVSTVRGQVPLDTTTLTIKNRDGAVMYPMSAIPLSQLTAQKWEDYNVMYQKQNQDDSTVTPGSSLLVDRTTYPTGCSYVLTTSDAIIATGAL